jgi:hypothetical protein
MLAGRSPIPTMVCEKPMAVAFDYGGASFATNAFSTPSVIAA